MHNASTKHKCKMHQVRKKFVRLSDRTDLKWDYSYLIEATTNAIISIFSTPSPG